MEKMISSVGLKQYKFDICFSTCFLINASNIFPTILISNLSSDKNISVTEIGKYNNV